MDKKTRPVCMLSKRDPPQSKRSIQTEGKGMEKIFQISEQGKRKSWVSNIYIRHNKYENKRP